MVRCRTYMNLKKRILALQSDLTNPEGISISTNKNYPFAIFHYFPEEEFLMRTEMNSVVSVLRTKGWEILQIDLLNIFLSKLNEIDNGISIQAFIKSEKENYIDFGNDYEESLQVLSNSLNRYFENPEFFPLWVKSEIGQITANKDPKNTILFVSRIGGLYPFYRVSTLLRSIDNETKYPTIILYPGHKTEQFYLSFMGVQEADRDYRPRIY